MADQGFTRTQLIAMADARTEKRGKVLNLDAEFLTALQEFCLEQRWWWRKKSVAFNTVAGTATYDLGDSTRDSIDCEQIVKGGVKLFTSGTTYTELTPIFDSDEQDVACEDTTQGQPANYFIERGTSQTLRLTSRLPAESIASALPTGRFRILQWIRQTRPDSARSRIPAPHRPKETRSANLPLHAWAKERQVPAAQGEYMAARREGFREARL
jgi:hypothetical protein